MKAAISAAARRCACFFFSFNLSAKSGQILKNHLAYVERGGGDVSNYPIHRQADTQTSTSKYLTCLRWSDKVGSKKEMPTAPATILTKVTRIRGLDMSLHVLTLRGCELSVGGVSNAHMISPFTMTREPTRKKGRPNPPTWRTHIT